MPRITEKQNIGFVYILGFGFLLILLLFGYVISQPKVISTSQSDTLSVTGNAKLSVEPDKAQIYIRINTLNVSAKIARDENSQITSKVISALQNIGVNKSDIETESFNLIKQVQYNPQTQQNEFKGYQLTHVLKVSTLDITTAADIIDTSINNGANGVDRVTFDLSDKKRKDTGVLILKMATENAKQKAHSLAENLGIKLGKIKSASESNFIYTPYTTTYNLLSSKEDMQTSIESKKVDISASVNVNYKIR